MASVRSLALSLVLLLLLSPSLAAASAEERDNKSSSLGGLFWATGKDESDLLPVVDSDDPSAVERESDEFAGGFSSLDGMLQWAIGHSDPVKLKDKANDIQKLSAEELKKRQLEIKQELMERLKMPLDAELMQTAISDLNNSSISLEDRQRALNELLILVEPIDNANDLDKLGGLVAVIRELHHSDPEIRTTSAWILGKASQNNALVQNQILAYGALTKLMKMVNSSFTEAIKALYAISALIRNNEVGQKLFYLEDGIIMLQDIMTNSSMDIRLQKKAVFLVADLADSQLGNADNAELFFLSDHLFLKAVVDLTSAPDLDLQEKALMAIRSLLQLTSTKASDFKDFCSLDEVLERMREHLGKLMSQEEHTEYARDLESLRKEVYTIFHKKVEQV